MIIVKGISTVSPKKWTCELGVEFKSMKSALQFARKAVGQFASLAAMHGIDESRRLEGSRNERVIRKFFRDYGRVTLQGREVGRVEIWDRGTLIKEQTAIANSFPKHLRTGA